MKLTIDIITAIMKYEAEQYKKGYDEAIKTKKEAEKTLNENFKKGTDFYKKQKEAINTDFEETIGKLKVTAAERGLKDVKDLREQEKKRIQNIDETLLAKIRAVSDIPMTQSELTALADKLGTKDNYWASRMLSNIAEKNGIDFFDRALEPSYDTKMSVLDQLVDQFDNIISKYPADKWDGGKVNHLYLSDRVIANAKAIYGGKITTASDEQIADKAYWTVRGQGTQIEKGIAISNVLRNAKGETRNLLLCKLAEDNTIQEMAYKLSGYSEEINSFKYGKAKEYRKAQRIMNDITNITDREVVQNILTENVENNFLSGLVEQETKKNEYFASLVMPETSTINNIAE